MRIASPHGRSLALGGGRTQLMGVLNVTPDSFSDGGRFVDSQVAVAHAEAMVEAGASILDLGAESTRPGHAEVPAAQQLERLMPVLDALRPRIDVPISIDTTRAEVAATALAAGADWINDTTALSADADLAAVVAEHRCPVVLMHRFAPARTPAATPPAGRRLAEVVAQQLAAAADRAQAAGIAKEAILLDPGIGFGTTAEDCVALLAHVDALRAAGFPLVVGPSRKSFLGQLTGREVEARLAGTAAAVACLALGGVEIVRVHDVAEMRDVVTVSDAVRTAEAAR